VGAVDVHDVQRDRDARGATGFGDELVGDQVRRYLVKDARDLERQRALAAQLPGGEERHRGRLPAGRGGAACHRLARPRVKRIQSVVDRPPVQRPLRGLAGGWRARRHATRPLRFEGGIPSFSVPGGSCISDERTRITSALRYSCSNCPTTMSHGAVCCTGNRVAETRLSHICGTNRVEARHARDN
jgi:hypothetical protein